MQNGNGNGTKPLYAFGQLKLDAFSRTLIRDGEEVHIAERPFDILLELIENRDRVIKRAELLDRFWDGHDVYDDALRKCIGSIRKAIGDTSRPARFIETRYGGGYRFVGDVQVVSSNGNGLKEADPNTDSNSIVPNRKPYFAGFLRPLAISATVLLIALLTLGFYVLARGRQAAVAAKPADPIARIRTIAVMPLKNLTGKAENEYFSDGVTDSIITELARANDLKVISRTSTFSFKGREVDPREIGRELGVDALLEGTVQAKGDVVNIRVRLIDASDGSILWTSNDFERQFSTASDLQDVIACSVAAELRTELCEKGAVQHTKSGLAYQEYLKGRYEWNKRTAAGIAKSIEHYKVAIELDPTYAKAHAGLSESYSMGLWYIPFSTEFAVPKATDAARRAIELDPASAEALTAFGSASLLAWRWDEAGEAIRRAIELDPNYARAFHVNAFYLTAMGRYGEATASIRRAHELDPKNLVISADTANILLHGHRADPTRIDAAISECDRLIASDPEYAETYDYRATAYLLKGQAEHFAADLIEGKRRRGQTSLERYSAAIASSDTRGIFRLLLAEELDAAEKTKPKSVRIGALYSRLGDDEQAFKWLKRAVNERSAEAIALAQHVWLDGLRDNPSFQELLNRTGLPAK